MALDDPEALADALATVAEATLSEVEAEGGFDPDFQAYARRRWLAGLRDREPAGILKVWLDEERDAVPARRPRAVEASFDDLPVGPLRLKGVLDRLDELPSGALVVTDYKTGAPPTRQAVAEGWSLQPYAYASAVAALHPDRPVVSSFLSLARPDALRRTGWMGDPDTLREVCSPGERRGSVAITAAGRQSVLERAGARATELLAGRFPTTDRGPEAAGCASCPYARICRADHPRVAGASE